MFVPEGVVTNERMSRLMDTNDEWIRQRTGIEERRYARQGTSSCDLGVEAARRALEDAGLEAGDIDLIVFATMTPAHYFPGNGGLLASKLGLDKTHALDIRMQCAGFLSGLHVADAFIRSGDLPARPPRRRRVPRLALPVVRRRVGGDVRRFRRPRLRRSLRVGHRAARSRRHLRGRSRGFRPRSARGRRRAGTPRFRNADGRLPLGQALCAGRRLRVVPLFLAEAVRREPDGAGGRRPAGVPPRHDGHAGDRPRDPRQARVLGRGPLAAPHAPGEPADQRVRPEEPGTSGRESLQQHPAIRKHDGRHAAARLPRGEAGRPDPRRETSSASPRSARGSTGARDSFGRDRLDPRAGT